ncbi:eukaryotic translation initiation factor eIF-1 [Cenococcum geophilum]
MASKKDMRRLDLIVPHVEPAKDKSDGDMTSTMASTLPMATIFTRNKMIGWTAVVFALQSWLAETPEQKRTATTPSYFSVGMAFMSLMVKRHAAIDDQVTPHFKKNARSFTSNQRADKERQKSLGVATSFRRTDPSPLQLQNQPLLRTQPSRQQHQLSTILPQLILSGTSIASLSLPNRNLPKVVWAHSEFMSIENLKTFAAPTAHLQLYAREDATLSARFSRLPVLSVVETPLLTFSLATDPFAEADEDTGETKQSQNYIHIRIQQRNGRKTLTTVQGLPKKFDQKKILKVIKKKFACNGTIVNDTEMGEVIQLQGDQRKDVQEFLTDKKEGLELDPKTIKVHGF